MHHTACSTYSVHDDKADLRTYHLRMMKRRKGFAFSTDITKYTAQKRVIYRTLPR